MSVSNLVQVGSGLWVQPSDVVRIYRTDERPGGEVYVVFEEPDGGVFNTHPTRRCYRPTDWPIERVQAALGLVSVNDLGRIVDGEGATDV